MEQSLKESLIGRISAGILFCHINVMGNPLSFILKNPARLERYRATEIYQEALYEASYSYSFSKSQINNLLIGLGLYTIETPKKIEQLTKDIDELKVTLFKAYLDSKKVKKLKELLNQTRDMLYKLEGVRHSYDYITPEGLANMIKTQYLVGVGLHDMNEKRVWVNEEFFNDDFAILEKVLSYVNRNQIEFGQLRELSRTDPWRSYWQANKSDIFGIPTIDWTDEQKTLILFSRMYDNAYSHPECPSDVVIEDDDMFDGWMIEEKRKADRERNTKTVDNTFGKLKGDEIFLFPAIDKKGKVSQEDIKKIEDLNTFEGKMIKKARNEVIKKRGKVREDELPDRKREIMVQANEQYIAKVKGK